MAETQKDAEYQFNSSIYPVTLDLELDSSKSMLRDMPTRLDLRKIGDGGDRASLGDRGLQLEIVYRHQGAIQAQRQCNI